MQAWTAVMARRELLPDAYYTIDTPGGEEAADLGRTMRETEYTMWRMLVPDELEDYELAVPHATRLTGQTRRYADDALIAHHLFQLLPTVPSLQEETYFPDSRRIIALSDGLCELDRRTGDALAHIDLELAIYLVPRKPGETLPSARQLRRKVLDLISALDLRKPPEDKEPAPDRGTSTTTPTVVPAWRPTPAPPRCWRSRRPSPASPPDTMCPGRRRCGASSPANRRKWCSTSTAPTTSAYVFGAGRQCPDVTDALTDLAQDLRDMDKAGHKESRAYRTPDDIKAYVMGRDGTCRYPTGPRRADRTQMDDRIDFEAGGPTSAGNLVCLCQHDHNIKTDARAYYIMDRTQVTWFGCSTTAPGRPPSRPARSPRRPATGCRPSGSASSSFSRRNACRKTPGSVGCPWTAPDPGSAHPSGHARG